MDIRDGIIVYLKKEPAKFGKDKKLDIRRQRVFNQRAWPRLLKNRTRRYINKSTEMGELATTQSFIKRLDKDYSEEQAKYSSRRSLSVKKHRVYKRPNSATVKKLKKDLKV